MKIAIEELLPKRTLKNSLIKIEIKQDKAVINWKHKGRGKHSTPVILPKKFSMNEETIALMGFFLGDGLKSNKGAAAKTLSFTNSEPQTVKWAMMLFRLFGINKKRKLKASVSVRGIVSKNEVKDYWRKITQIPKENMSVNIRPSLSLGKRNLPPVKKYGAIKIEYYSVILRNLVLRLLELSVSKAKKEPKFAKAFLKGLAAAEGCPVLNHGKLVNVVISCCDEDNKKIIKKIVHRCHLIHSVRNDGIVLHRNNFKNRYYHDIFSYHPERHKRFMLGLKPLKF